MLMPSLLALGLSVSSAPAPDQATVLPTRFEADRVYVVPETADGKPLRLYTDTGGAQFLKQAAAKRLNLALEPVTDAALLKEVGGDVHRVQFPAFAPNKAIPALSGDGGRMLVFPDRPSPVPGLSADDGMLGTKWFAGRVWTWDYLGQRLTIEGPHWRAPEHASRAPLAFKRGADGKRATDFPRIDIRVDGQVLPVLLDTGAMTLLTPEALKAIHDDRPAERATSMIADTVFQAWRKAHPQWRVIEKAQAGTGSAMIEVPEVEIAGLKVGPVWFTHRPDRAFHEFMSSMMDTRVEGALGGNAFRHLVMTVDYPGAAAYFRCARDCTR